MRAMKGQTTNFPTGYRLLNLGFSGTDFRAYDFMRFFQLAGSLGGKTRKPCDYNSIQNHTSFSNKTLYKKYPPI